MENFLEFSCSKVNNCKLIFEEEISHVLCNGTCPLYEWNGRFYPLKIEYFSNNKIEEMVEKLNFDEDSINNINLEISIYLEDMAEVIANSQEIMGEDVGKSFIAPMRVRKLLEEYLSVLKLKKEAETDYYKLLLKLKEVRQEYKKFKKLVESLKKKEED